MNNKLYLSDKLKHLDDVERRYVEYSLSGGKMSDWELNMVLDDRLDYLRTDLALRRLVAELKIERMSRKHLIDDFKLKETTKLIPLALKTLVEIMQNGKEHNRLSAAQTVLRPALAYLERTGQAVAEMELSEQGDGKVNFTLNVAPFERKAD